MPCIVLLEGMGAYGPILLAPVEGLGPFFPFFFMGGGYNNLYFTFKYEVPKVEAFCIFQTSGTMAPSPLFKNFFLTLPLVSMAQSWTLTWSYM